MKLNFKIIQINLSNLQFKWWDQDKWIERSQRKSWSLILKTPTLKDGIEIEN